MTVRADHAGHGITDRHAIAHLRNRGVVMLPENLERAVLILRCLRLDCDIGRNGLRFPRQMLLAGGVTKRAPCRHGALTRPINLGIGIKSGLDSQSPGALFVSVRSHLILLRCPIRYGQATPKGYQTMAYLSRGHAKFTYAGRETIF
jgi:hypothetical protein